MNPQPSQSGTGWYVFHERDDGYAVTVGKPDGVEREVSVQKVAADTEEAAILTALRGSYSLADASWRVWAIPASDVRPRPFTLKRRTQYDPELGRPFTR
jgi:hypothetical protein